tara:strand:+ start:245 stop:643 length:399 start_codon:yes stop_codon:yes gene_type:complete
MGYWIDHVNISFDNELHFLYGFGPGGVRHVQVEHGNPESFYFRIFNESGLLGIMVYFFGIVKILLMINNFKYLGRLREEKILLTLLIMIFLLQSIANEPFYSNGCSQIFAFIILYVSSKNFMINRLINSNEL